MKKYYLTICVVISFFYLTRCVLNSVEQITEIVPSFEPSETQILDNVYETPSIRGTSRLSNSTPTENDLAPTLNTSTEPQVRATETILPINNDGILLENLDIHGEWNISGLIWSNEAKILKLTRFSSNQKKDYIIESWEYIFPRGEIKSNTFKINHAEKWDRLELDSFAYESAVSPSGQWVIFTKISQETTPKTSEISPTPVEIWIARIDGSNAIKIGGPLPGCQNMGKVIWIEQEKKIIFTCGFDGPDLLYIANTDGSKISYLDEIVGISLNVGFKWISISPDQTRLAFTDYYGVLHIIKLDGIESQEIPFGLAPYWSYDGERLFYIKGSDVMFAHINGINMCEIKSGTESQILASPVIGPDGEKVSISPGPIAVSPMENSIIFYSNGFWLASLMQ